MGFGDLAAETARAARALGRAIVPVACPGCGLADVVWCEGCAAPWWEPPFRCEDGAGRLAVVGRKPLPVWAVAPLAGPTHLAIGAWKDGGRRDLDPFFASALRRSAATVASALACATAVVAVPSRAAAVRRRGADLTRLLGLAVVEALADAGIRAPLVAALRHSGIESGGLQSRSRWENARRGIHVRTPPRGAVAVLVDDVMTTGASLARSCAALEAGGVAVVAGLVLAATPGKPGLESPR